MPDKSHKLVEHLKKEHKASTFQTYLKEIIYGGNDGIVTTFAVVAGFAGASIGGDITVFSFLTVLLFGLANLFADGASMGLGNFLSLRAEQDVYKSEENKERHEIRNSPQQEKEETMDILLEKGFTKEQATTLTEIYSSNEEYWTSFMMNYELEMSNPKGENPYLTGLATFSAFIFFGIIPLIPYMITQGGQNAFLHSLIATFSALVLLGIIRWRVTSESLFRCVFEMILIGGSASVIAYIVGTFFRL